MPTMATTLSPKKMMQLNFMDMTCTSSHMFLGQWKNPLDNSRHKDRLEYYIWMAKLAEKGKVTSIFFADVYGNPETYGGNPNATYLGGAHVAHLDPVVLISAMAQVTKSVSFGVTGNTSYISPYILARTWATLDHVTNGRMGWNIVTGFGKSAARCMGKDDVLAHDERYLAAQEYMDIVYQLWERSWEDGAQVWREEPEMAYDPSKIHRIEFEGKYHKFSGYAQTHPSPQRTPTLFQAGSSNSGIKFAGKHAEGIYCGEPNIPHVLKYSRSVREAAKEHGRDPSSIKLFAGISPILGRTEEEAIAKYKLAKSKASAVAGLALFCDFTGIDLSKWDLDEPFSIDNDAEGAASIQGVFKNFKGIEKDTPWTPRMVGEETAFLEHVNPMPVGTPEMVADFMEKWLVEADVDGFSIQCISNPGSFEDVVELLIPELQRRGIYRTEYPVASGTFRENMQNKPDESLLPNTHPAASYRWT